MRAGRFTTAAEAFQRAVAIDSAFALAWYRLSVAWEWLTRHDLVREAAEKAFRHSGRLSEHDRQLFEAAVATRNGDPARAEELYRAILANYPDDVEAWSQLGEVLHHYGPLEGRPMSAAREAFERVLFYEPDEVTALVHLVRTAAREGNRTQLDSLVRRAIELTPEGDRAVEMRTLRALTIGDTAERRIVLADLEHATDPPLFVTAWDLPIASGNLDAGRTVASILTQPARSPEVRALGHMNLAYLYATQGRWRQARVELAAAESLDSTRALELGAYLMAVPLLPVSPTDLQNERAAIRHLDPAAVAASMHPSAWVAVHNGLHEHLKLYLVGLLSARLGDAAAAESCAAALERLPSPHGADSFSLDLALGLRAQVARAAGRPEEALQLLERAPRRRWYQLTLTSPFFSQAAERYLRAALLEETGRQEEALRWYSSFEEVSQFDLAFLPASHLQRAAIYEQRGDLERAAHYLRRFIELWSAADPELLPLVRRAEQRLAALGEASQTP
jgi:tetratricopeptide (TPR) repeat protein